VKTGKQIIMKKLFTITLLLFCVCSFAQTYNNEWIDPAKTYYKFKTARTGLYRIPQSTLASLGLDVIPVEQFKMWRNGAELPLYTSSQTGLLPANGYIEFWSDANDGKPDKPMYRDPAFQHTDKISLQTDTVVYFLTVDPMAANARTTDAANNIAGNSLLPEPYFTHKLGTYFKARINAGLAAVLTSTYVYSSSYDKGEYWSTGDIAPSGPLTYYNNNLYPYLPGSTAQLRFGTSGNANNTRSVQAKVNGVLVKDTLCEYFNDAIVSANFPANILSAGNGDVSFTNTSPVSTDRMVISFYELSYPRLFNFGGNSNFYFEMPATSTGYFLQINNFNNGSVNPVLYDKTNNVRYVGDVSTPGVVKFVLPPSLNELHLNLVSEDPSNFINIDPADFKVKKFIDFTQSANQGNYLIITNSALYSGTSGANPLADYKNYRNSIAGGGYVSTIVEIDELVDQFAFGIKKHPLSIKNFLRFARAKFAAKPQFVFLIGHGTTYTDYRSNIANPLAEQLNAVPTFGYPASDNLLSADDVVNPIPLTPIGRLSIVTAQELSDYLQKVKEYESAQKNNPNTITDRGWMKNILQVTGASDASLGSLLCSYMDDYRQIVADTLTGANVSTFCKATTGSVTQLSNDLIAQLFEQGLSMVTYFGHSSANVLEFNIADPQTYNNQGKYPIFSVNGCNAGNFFVYDPQRFSFSETLSEKFTLAKERGGVAFLASTHFGIVNYLNLYLSYLYSHIAHDDFGKSLGKIYTDALQQLVNVAGPTDFYARLTTEEMALHGDPALAFNFQSLPDYVIEASQIKLNPQFISVSARNFNLNINIYNIGKAVQDSVTVLVQQQYPNNNIVTLLKKRMPAINYLDSLQLIVPIVASRDKGLNKIIVTIDPDNLLTEITKINNSATVQFYIYEDEIKPVYPYDLSIVNKQNLVFSASTANPFSLQKDYVMEMDTTINFNSPLKISKTLSSVGGLLEFNPGMQFHDSTVYYWRTASVPTGGSQYHWNMASFIYLPNSSEGFDQAHYYQHLQSTEDRIHLSASSREWEYNQIINDVLMRNAVYPTASPDQVDYQNTVNNSIILGPGCAYNELIIQVLDGKYFRPMLNNFTGPTGLYNSALANCGTHREFSFDYSLGTSTTRKYAMDFLDSIKDGSYVIVRTNSNPNVAGNTFSSVWKGDTSLFGSNNSLYHKLYNQGFTDIDSFSRPRCFIFIFKKNDKTSFTPVSKFSLGIYDRITLSSNCPTLDTLGYTTSPQFGPSKSWKQVHWRGKSKEQNSSDNPTVDVVGVSNAGVESTLYTLNLAQQDFDISSVSAIQYPFIKLRMRNVDSVSQTPYQISYWKLDYDPVPEGALIPNLYLKTKNPGQPIDTLDLGEPLNFGIAFKNISDVPFDSLKIKLYYLDRNNVQHDIPFSKGKPLVAGDSIKIDFSVDTKNAPGLNTLYVDFNPDNDQPEQYHFNNFLYRNFYVRPDNSSPYLDVTFDNIHILNRDIVSTKPHIQIKLKDDAKYLLLNDTAGITVQVRYTKSNTIKTYQFGTDTLRFIPAISGNNNTAIVDFNPQFLTQIDPSGDEYELIVTGKDRSGNASGKTQYKVVFRIISKPMVSNLLNYPNPFTTSTAFVFTITGTDVPDNMKIQILTVTGKIVREITRQELGNLHIGRNITDYKWDGTDQFGQRLANGVYLYRFVTSINGKRMDKFSDYGDNTDRFFTQGYGKMYLMR
jgi:hypothetical protein